MSGDVCMTQDDKMRCDNGSTELRTDRLVTSSFSYGADTIEDATANWLDGSREGAGESSRGGQIKTSTASGFDLIGAREEEGGVCVGIGIAAAVASVVMAVRVSLGCGNWFRDVYNL